MPKLADWLYSALGGHKCGNVCAPCDWMQLEPPLSYPPVVHVSEDAFTLWMGTADEWHTHLSRDDARRLAWFILWRWWVLGEWFGLRRWLWFKLLSVRVRRYQPKGS